MEQRRRFRRRLRLRMTAVTMILYCFGATLWVQDALSFHHPLQRRIANFDEASIICQNKRRRCITDALVASESEVEIAVTTTTTTTTESSPVAFDCRKIPPISDTTPCEVIERCHIDGNDKSTLDGDPSGEEEEFYFPSPQELAVLPKGDRGGYHIVRQYTVTGDTITNTASNDHANFTLQHALTVLDPEHYPTLTRARKACRKGMVLVDRTNRATAIHPRSNGNTSNASGGTNFRRGSVGDWVSLGDVIGVQMFLGTYRKKQCYPNIEYSRPQFQLPVLYENDHLAVVNKPAGVAVYSETRNGGSSQSTGNRRTVHFALPFVLTPPTRGTTGGILRRPGIVHRIDKPTSGLLLVAKTKAAMDHLYQQFRDRDVQKIYTAIVNGDVVPHQTDQQEQDEKKERHIRNGKDNDITNNNTHEDTDCWNLIDYPLGGKHALTSWKILRCSQSLNARDGVLTMVQVRLHTGRYHQIRRHFAWWCRRPLVGDHLYAGQMQAHHFRKKGLFLCSNGISFLHPFPLERGNDKEDVEPRRVEVTIDVPKRFDKLMNAEESWAIHKSKEVKEKDL